MPNCTQPEFAMPAVCIALLVFVRTQSASTPWLCSSKSLYMGIRQSGSQSFLLMGGPSCGTISSIPNQPAGADEQPTASFDCAIAKTNHDNGVCPARQNACPLRRPRPLEH